MVGRASGGRCLAELWNICGLSRLRVAVARSCATSAGDGGDVGLGPGADQHFAKFAAELIGEPELNRHGAVSRHIDLALERTTVS